jgi:transposase-like protein
MRCCRLKGQVKLLSRATGWTPEMARNRTVSKSKDTRRRYTNEFKEEAVQMMLDGHIAPSVMARLGLPNVKMLYRCAQEQVTQSGPVASSLEARVRELENELRRVELERIC